MKQLFFVLSLICSFTAGYAQLDIKTLKTYRMEDETALPVITSEGELTIEFDVNSNIEPNLNIVFKFCDKNWNPVDNIFLQNYGENVAYNLDFVLLPFTVQGVRYHFKGSFPDKNNFVSFPFSGKWKYFITDSQDTSIVFASGRFYFIGNILELNADLKKEHLEDKVYYPLSIGNVFNITTDFILPEELFPAYIDHIEIVENKKIDYPFSVDKNSNTNTRQFYWDGDRKISFIIRDIRPGNEYRRTDLRDINRFNSKNVRAQFDGIEYSRFFKPGRRDLNGGYLLTDFRNEFADYLNVKFSIRPPYEVFQSIFLVGAFNDWKILPEYELENIGGVYSKTIELKRGAYDYQYVAADVVNNRTKNEDWIVLEGNFWETENLYHIFIYYNDPNYGGYDRIIGYRVILSK
ncbi:MAG: type IX secretion system plug protein domain-containing protein [Ignavibacteria bacterium]